MNKVEATESLKHEHEVILTVFDILGVICNKIRHNEEPDMMDLERIMDFITVFVDKCHHGKEEVILFPEMVKAGMPSDTGPITVMITEHDLGREYVSKMMEAFEHMKMGDKSYTNQFVDNANRYIEIMKQHIDKENNILYDFADNMIPAESQKSIYIAFENLENEKIGKGVHEKFHSDIERLKSKYADNDSN